jgi:hypothetical protein
LLSGAEAGAVAIPLLESPCGSPPQELRCFGLQADLTTTYDQPIAEWTVTPILPPDPENWQLIGLSAGFGSSTYTFVYPDANTDLVAVLLVASFIDVDGRTFLTASNALQPFCQTATSGAHTGKWVCSDGNSLGSPYRFDPQNPLDPIPPALDGPITIRIAWSVFGMEVPEFSSMSANATTFGYVLEGVPIPEPSSGLLVLTGLLAMAHWRKRSSAALRAGAPADSPAEPGPQKI